MPVLTELFSITLPIVASIWGAVFVAAYVQNKRLDDIIAELRAIKTALTAHGEQIAKLQERIPPLIHH